MLIRRAENTLNLRHTILLFIAVFAVSWAAILVRLSGAPGIACALWRMVFSALILLVLSLKGISHELRRLSKRDILELAIPGIALALHFSLWMESLYHTTIAVSTTIVCTHPIYSTITAYLKLREKPSKRQIIGFILALIGVSLLYTATNQPPSIQAGNHQLGVLLALAGAITGGIYFGYGRTLRTRIPLKTYTLTVYTIAALTLLPIAIATKTPITSFPLRTWIAFILLALVPMMLGHNILNYLLRYHKAITVTSAVLGEPVGATILATIIFHETPSTITTYMGITTTLIGIALTIMDRGEPGRVEK